jgi:gliding motility-associated-like protein
MNTKANIFFLITLVSFSLKSQSQNLVPNPGLENIANCFNPPIPEISCLNNWNTLSGNAVLNTADLCYNGALFFPPSTINAYEGIQYAGIECSTQNPEFISVQLLQTLVAGKRYCVSFYASVCTWSDTVAPSLGVHFSNAPLAVNPTIDSTSAHVQGTVIFDGTSWTRITGIYTATGNENFITLGCFENRNYNSMGPYMYIDMIEVYEVPEDQIQTEEMCESAIVLDASMQDALSYSWNTGATSSSIIITQPGTYTAEIVIGACNVFQTFIVNSCSEIDTSDNTPDTTTEDYNIFMPNAFTPDNDGMNDIFFPVYYGMKMESLQIYDRWGELIFHSENANPQWDGSCNGKMVSEGVFVVIVNAKTDHGKHIRKNAHLVLVR